MKVKWFFLMPILFSFIGTTAQNVQKIRIEPTKAFGGTASEYFKTIEYIPLETNKESLFGEIKTLIITDKSIIILDEDTRSVLFFDLKGKFMKRIKKGNDSFPVTIVQDSYKNIISVFFASSSNPTLENSIFDYYGNFISKVEKYQGNPFLKPLGNDIYFYYKQLSKDTTHNFIDIYKDTAKFKSFIPSNKNEILSIYWLATNNTVNVVENGKFYFSSPFNHEVYLVNKDTAIKVFQFVFPAYMNISKQILNSNNEQFIKSNIYKNEHLLNKIVLVKDIFFKNNFLFFKADRRVYTGGVIDYQSLFILDTISYKLVSIEKIVSDKLSHYLPFVNLKSSKDGLKFYKDTFYTSISSLEMFEAKDATKNKNPQYPPVLEQYFKTQNRKSNPVIVKMKLKEFS